MRRYSSTPEDHLFNKGYWFATQEAWKQKLVASIEAMNGDELLNTSTSDLANYYASEFEFDVPTILPDDIVADQREAEVEVGRRGDPFFDGYGGTRTITGTAVDVELPYTGNKTGFDIQPITRNFNNPRAYVGSDCLKFSITGTNLTTDQVRKEVDSRVSSIKQHLEWLTKDAQGYIAGLLALATQTIERRKEKLLKGKSLVAGLGFKMKERPGASETFAAPSVRRKIKPATPKPKASRAPFEPEPTLTSDDYEHILKVLENMVQVMEQSPGAFRGIDEESLRTHFLVQLNGHFSSDATGETFNYEGKTDILIKVDGRSIFIGECKFWTGEKAYLETLDQVLSYLSWRDTKAAVLMFSRKKTSRVFLRKFLAARRTMQTSRSWYCQISFAHLVSGDAGSLGLVRE